MREPGRATAINWSFSRGGWTSGSFSGCLRSLFHPQLRDRQSSGPNTPVTRSSATVPARVLLVPCSGCPPLLTSRPGYPFCCYQIIQDCQITVHRVRRPVLPQPTQRHAIIHCVLLLLLFTRHCGGIAIRHVMLRRTPTGATLMDVTETRESTLRRTNQNGHRRLWSAATPDALDTWPLRMPKLS